MQTQTAVPYAARVARHVHVPQGLCLAPVSQLRAFVLAATLQFWNSSDAN